MNGTFELRTGDGVDLVDASGQRVVSVLSQPKRLALLTYLVVEGRTHTVRRDRLCAVFWPELDHRRARRNLRQSIHFLRGALGPDAISTHVTDEVGVEPERVRWNAGPPGAVFLDAFHFDGASRTWEDWVDEVRWSPAPPTEPQSHPAAAAQTSAGVATAFAEAAPATGEVVPAIAEPDMPPWRVRSSRHAGSARARRSMLAAASLAALGLTALVLSRDGRPGLPRSPDEGPSVEAYETLPAPRSTLAILPFENLSAGQDDRLVADGLALEIRARLTAIGDLAVVGRPAIQRLLASGVEPYEVGPVLGADHTLTGVVRMEGDRARVTVTLNDVRTGTELWTGSFDREREDLPRLEGEVALAVADVLEASLTGRLRDRLARPGTASVEAYRLYQRQRSLSGTGTETNRRGILLLGRAVELDPEYGEAWARLAWRHVWEVRTGHPESLDSARTYAERALDLDPGSSLAHFAAASVLATEERRSAVREFRQAVALSPSDPGTLTDLSFFLAIEGELEESLDVALRAVRLAPDDPTARWHAACPLLLLALDDRTEAWLQASLEQLGDREPSQPRNELQWVMLDILRGRPDAARERALVVMDRYGHVFEARLNAAAALVAMGEDDLAEPVLAPIAESTPEALVAIGGGTARTRYASVLLRAGERARALALLDESMARARARIEAGADMAPPYVELGLVHSVREEADLALQWLERAVDAGFRDYRSLTMHVEFEPIRGSPRFDELVDRIRRDVRRMADNAEREGLVARADSLLAAWRSSAR